MADDPILEVLEMDWKSARNIARSMNARYGSETDHPYRTFNYKSGSRRTLWTAAADTVQCRNRGLSIQTFLHWYNKPFDPFDGRWGKKIHR